MERKEEKGEGDSEFASRRRWWWAIILVFVLILFLIVEVMNGQRKLPSTHFNGLLTTAPIIIILFRVLLLLSIHDLPHPMAHLMRRLPTIIYVPIILIFVVVGMTVVPEDAVHRRHRVGDDNARTRDLFRIARKEAVRVVRSIAFFDLTLAFTLTPARLAFPRAKGR